LTDSRPGIVEAAVRALTDGLVWDLPGNPLVEDASLSVWFRGGAVMSQDAPIGDLPAAAVALVAQVVGDTLDELSVGHRLDDGRAVTRIYFSDAVGRSGYYASFDRGRDLFLGWREPTVGLLAEALARKADGLA
jgi:hypothetical protein